MDDDFNTPQAVAALNQLAALLTDEARSGADLRAGVALLVELGRVLGLSMEGHQARLAQSLPPEQRDRLTALVAEREAARKRRDWTRADALRAELDALGVVVEDTPAGPTWKPKARTGPSS
jgi:cysteinyl-tRNA synthetase